MLPSPTKTIQFRPYQHAIQERTLAAIDEGLESVLIISPTGSGKTIMGLQVARSMQEADPELAVVWVALRRTLLKQVVEENAFVGVKNLIPLSAFDTDVEGKLASLERVLLVFDEAHHSPADTLVSVWDHCEPIFTLGLTATAIRTDDMKLCFQRILHEAGYHRLIGDGYLSQYALHLLSSYTPESVAKTYLADPTKWGRSAIFFLSLEQCRECADLLNACAVRASVVSGTSDRETQIEDFEAGKIDVLLSAGVLTEGWDCPTLKSVFVRDGSKGPSIQMCGRVLRLDPANPIKNIIQSKNTEWNFGRTALPSISFSETVSGEWVSLKPDTKLLLDAIKQADAAMASVSFESECARHMANVQRRNARIRRKLRRDNEKSEGDADSEDTKPEAADAAASTAISKTGFAAAA